MALTDTSPYRASLATSYRRCWALHRRHGTTFYRATALLPRAQRPHVHALYGFCRYADEIVDDLGGTPVAERARALDQLTEDLHDGLAAGASDHPILAAVVDTATRFDLDPDCFDRFMRSMRMDLSVTRYATFDDLLGYMDGSAAVIGEMVLPILEPRSRRARPHARALGNAFQLTNFLRDVSEDLDRGRVYLPQADIDRFDARHALEQRRPSPGWTALMRFEVDRTRRLYDEARGGIDLLPWRSARCIRVAFILYGEILDQIEHADHDVFRARARVPSWRKAAVAAGVVARRLPPATAPIGPIASPGQGEMHR